jgi:tetratricopeptide (TPR) repeat protein
MRKMVVSFLCGLFLLGISPLHGHAQEAGSPDPALREAMQLANDGKYTEAIDEIKLIIQRQPGTEDIHAHLSLGLVYFKSKQYGHALDEFQKTISIRKETPMAYYFTGLIYEMNALGEIDRTARNSLKMRALESWQNYLEYRSKIKPKAHKDGKIIVKDGIGLAKRHIKRLKEDLSHE